MPSLLAVLGLDKSQFTAGLNSAKGEARTAGASIGGALASAIGGALSVAGIGMAFNSILQKVSDIKKEGIETGFDTDSLQKFNFALTQMNIDIQSGNTGLGKMNELIGQAVQGEKHAVDTFARWGISVTGKSNVQIMDEIRQSILATTDPAQRVAEAMEIFGRGGRELLPYLTTAKEELDTMSAHAPIISKEDIENVDEAKRDIEEVKSELQALGAHAIKVVVKAVKESAQDVGTSSGAGQDQHLTGDNWTDAPFLNWILGGNRGAEIIKDAKLPLPPLEKNFMTRRIKNKPPPDEYSQFGQTKPLKSLADKISSIKIGDFWTGVMGDIQSKPKPEAQKSSPGEAHRINRMMELNSMQKIGAYAATPPGYMEMVRASVQTAKHISSIDSKIQPPGRSVAPTRY